MPNLFKIFIKRLQVDYKEWYDQWMEEWAVRSQLRQIDAAIKKAKKRNAKDKRTYYIIMDRRGAINALTKKEIDYWSDNSRGLFPKMTINQVYHNAIDIVTCNKIDMEQFSYIKSKNHEQKNRQKSS